MRKMETVSKNSYLVFTSAPFMAALTIFGIWSFISKEYLWGLAVYALVIAAILVLCRDIMPLLLPLLLASMTVLWMYKAQVSEFLTMIPIAVVLVGAVIAHFVIYRIKKVVVGRQFYSLVAVSAALILGGLFTISPNNYFRPIMMYYVPMLSVGMIVFYLIMRNYIHNDGVYNAFKTLYRSMIFIGIMGFGMIMSVVIPSVQSGTTWNIQWSNNLSTFILLAMPFSFYASVKSKYGAIFFMLGILNYLTIFFTFSRGGMIFGSIMFLVCVIGAIIACENFYKWIYLAMLGVVIAAAVYIMYKGTDVKAFLEAMLNVSPTEPRAIMFKVAIKNFIANPIFGAGMGFEGPAYYPVDGAMYWYHSTPFQIIGSMGLVGVIAYTYQFFVRMDILSLRKRKSNLFILLSFMGFEAMAFVNPGDFCPIPYVLVLVGNITVAEICNESPSKETNDFLKTNLIVKRKEWLADCV